VEEPETAPSTGDTGTAGTVELDEDSKRLQKFAEELVSVSNKIVAGLQGVTDADSAASAAPTIQPLIDRQDDLMNQMTAAEEELGEKKYNEAVRPYRAAITTSTLQAMQAQEKVFANAELLLAWEDSVKKSEVRSGDSEPPAATPSEDPVEVYLEQLEQFAEMNQEFCGILDGVSNRDSAKAAAEQIQNKLPDYERTVRQMTAGFVQLSDADKDRAMQELARRPRPRRADIVSSVSRALRGSAPEELRPAMGRLMNVYIQTLPDESAKQKLRQQLIDQGL
jgi:hypothetical protein